MITLKEVEENELLDFKLLGTIPRKCKCGSDIVFDDSLQEIRCQDVNCKFELTKRLLRFTREMGQTSWNINICEQLINEFDIKTPFNLFDIPYKLSIGKRSQIIGINNLLIEVCDPNKKLSTDQIRQNISLLQDSKLREMTLSKLLQLECRRDIAEIADELTYGVGSISELYAYIHTWPVAYIAQKLDLKTDKELQIAAEIQKELTSIEGELRFGEKKVQIVQSKALKLNMQSSGVYQGFDSFYEFSRYIKSRYNNKIVLNMVPQIFNKSDIYIQDFDKDSENLLKAQNINEQYQLYGIQNKVFNKSDIGNKDDNNKFHLIGEKIFIGTADELVNRLDEIDIDTCNKEE